MAQMNKRPDSGTSARESLEKELMGNQIKDQVEKDTGRAHHPTQYSSLIAQSSENFQIRQGTRRRHPLRVLQQYDGVYNTTSDAESMWEQALVHAHERVGIDDIYQPKGDVSMLNSQLGLVQASNVNSKKSTMKLESILGL